MTDRSLDLEIFRKNRREDRLTVDADPADTGRLRDYLRGWLESEGWDEGQWVYFTLVARPAGEGRVLAKVRAA